VIIGIKVRRIIEIKSDASKISLLPVHVDEKSLFVIVLFVIFFEVKTGMIFTVVLIE
jgi:hypothetical protein